MGDPEACTGADNSYYWGPRLALMNNDTGACWLTSDSNHTVGTLNGSIRTWLY
jgi:hypothetical protein